MKPRRLKTINWQRSGKEKNGVRDIERKISKRRELGETPTFNCSLVIRTGAAKLAVYHPYSRWEKKKKTLSYEETTTASDLPCLRSV